MTDEKTGKPGTTPHDYDESADKRVEKKPAGEESPQQQHNDEDHG
jgi:hypothetical protein